MKTKSKNPAKNSKPRKHVDKKHRASWPMDSTWISPYTRKDHSKGQIPVRGFWKKRNSQKPKDPTVKVLDFLHALNEMEYKISVLVAGLEEATRELNGLEGNNLVIGAASGPPEGTPLHEAGGVIGSPTSRCHNEEPPTQH